jgi:hypothetical protein
LPPYLDEVFQLYEVPEDQRAEIIRYACHHPGVTRALRDTVPELERVFGKNRRRRLDLFQFEDGGGDEQLLGVVLIEKFPQNAFELEQQFYRAFFSKVPREVHPFLSFLFLASMWLPKIDPSI